jgi:hypothetical protein
MQDKLGLLIEMMHDKQLFTQPDRSYMGECPICCLPRSIDESKSVMMGCCGKIICNGCEYAIEQRKNEEELDHSCPLCQEHMPKSQKESDKNHIKRIKKTNDPVAMAHMGKKHQQKGEYDKAFCNIIQRPLSWVVCMRIGAWELCITMEKVVLRRT